ncbi:uncharacterized protein SETTUDRAFT_178645 [Exserohilum turcica Et28A]|uniref:Uncharacterized protein n=1 Tax=Exserohilum turcicum (strain 28A) TaxID=671987 RepID=R0KB42_EXST2|nr:uncharacterized protein SETTUDRAFT_178645 [Exserohilum turcica Et28A]EOA86599.1 hypothetical protein SETTUDRAFT_178645 [Exserohilum turcica Et28A]
MSVVCDLLGGCPTSVRHSPSQGGAVPGGTARLRFSYDSFLQEALWLLVVINAESQAGQLSLQFSLDAGSDADVSLSRGEADAIDTWNSRHVLFVYAQSSSTARRWRGIRASQDIGRNCMPRSKSTGDGDGTGASNR